MNKVINSIDELDDLDLDLEDTNVDSVSEELSLDNIEDTKSEHSIDDLELEDVTPEVKPTDDLTVEAERKDPLDEEIELDLDVNNGNSVSELKVAEEQKQQPEQKKRGRKSKVVSSDELPEPPKVNIDKDNAPYIVNDMQLSLIDSDHYRFLVKPLNLQNFDKMIEDHIRITGEPLNPLQVAIEDGNYKLISGFNTFDVLEKMQIKTTMVLVFPKLSTYSITRKYVTAPHHLD